MTGTKFPPVRACLFDMDGLLLDTEDIASQCHTLVLAKYGRPALPPHIKAKMMGRNGTAAAQILQGWAQLPITNAEYRREVAEHQNVLFSGATPLPGVETLLGNLASTEIWKEDGKAQGGLQRVHIALATSSSSGTFKTKTAKLQCLFSLFEPERLVLGDDSRLASGRGKPMPDIYQLALKTINESLAPGEQPIAPAECLVFEDSVTGVEAGRRAGMRVIWCPLPTLVKEYAGVEAEVLAGRTGSAGEGVDEHQLGEIGDGWAEQVSSLVDFPYEKYGIVIPGNAHANGTTVNGVHTNGMTVNGVHVNGTETNGTKEIGIVANGTKNGEAMVNGAEKNGEVNGADGTNDNETKVNRHQPRRPSITAIPFQRLDF